MRNAVDATRSTQRGRNDRGSQRNRAKDRVPAQELEDGERSASALVLPKAAIAP
jgi:hypothetical protein